MRAMLLEVPGRPLRALELSTPEPGPGQVLVRIRACAVCRTDLHLVDGELPRPKLPVIPGHEIVGEVVRRGAGVDTLRPGQRVGIPWLGHTCGCCWYCLHGAENLCDVPGFTGYTIDGGYADHTVADAAYCFPLPEIYGAVEAAPLLCAGLIGYRSLSMAGQAERLGLYGFGAAAHMTGMSAAPRRRPATPATTGGGRARKFGKATDRISAPLRAGAKWGRCACRREQARARRRGRRVDEVDTQRGRGLGAMPGSADGPSAAGRGISRHVRAGAKRWRWAHGPAPAVAVGSGPREGFGQLYARARELEAM